MNADVMSEFLEYSKHISPTRSPAEIDVSIVSAWRFALKGYQDHEITTAFKNLWAHSPEVFPTVALIKRYIAGDPRADLTIGNDLTCRILEAIRKFGQHQWLEAAAYIGKLGVLAVTTTLRGWKRITDFESDIELYNESRSWPFKIEELSKSVRAGRLSLPALPESNDELRGKPQLSAPLRRALALVGGDSSSKPSQEPTQDKKPLKPKIRDLRGYLSKQSNHNQTKLRVKTTKAEAQAAIEILRRQVENGR